MCRQLAGQLLGQLEKQGQRFVAVVGGVELLGVGEDRPRIGGFRTAHLFKPDLRLCQVGARGTGVAELEHLLIAGKTLESRLYSGGAVPPAAPLKVTNGLIIVHGPLAHPLKPLGDLRDGIVGVFRHHLAGDRLDEQGPIRLCDRLGHGLPGPR